MPSSPNSANSQWTSVLDTRHLSASDILSLFEHATELARIGERFGNFYDPRENLGRIQRLVACLFFEASTRTRLSFQTAIKRLGHNTIVMSSSSATSMSKGESDVDTVLNVLAMGPDALVVRSNHSPALEELLASLKIPVISAGTGVAAHPTQSLLDAYTIHTEKSGVKGQRVLIFGDIKHSRVARSNFDVLAKLGAEVAICGPDELLPEQSEIPGVKIYTDFDEALKWPSVVMGLRIQLERHGSADMKQRLEEYHGQFGLSRERLKKLSKDAMIMHPGPINHGVEFAPEVSRDPRNRVLKQVTNGVLIRASLVSKIFGVRDQGR